MFCNRVNGKSQLNLQIFLPIILLVIFFLINSDAFGISQTDVRNYIERERKAGRKPDLHTIFREYPCDFSGLDLSGVDLSNLDLIGSVFIETKLTDANLAGADITFAAFNKADMRGADFTGTELDRCSFAEADLRGAKGFGSKNGNLGFVVNAQKVNLSGTDLRNSDLSSLKLNHANLTGANLSGATMADANLHDANIAEVTADGTIAINAYMSEEQRKYLSMRGAIATGIDLENAVAKGVDLSNTIFYKSNLSNLNLSGAILRNANLLASDLSGAKLQRANLNGAFLLSSKIDKTNFQNAQLRGCEMGQTSLRNADLSGADLSNANLFGTHFVDSNLSGANFSGADLRKASFVNCRLEDTVLANAKIRNTKLEGDAEIEHLMFVMGRCYLYFHIAFIVVAPITIFVFLKKKLKNRKPITISIVLVFLVMTVLTFGIVIDTGWELRYVGGVEERDEGFSPSHFMRLRERNVVIPLLLYFHYDSVPGDISLDKDELYISESYQGYDEFTIDSFEIRYEDGSVVHVIDPSLPRKDRTYKVSHKTSTKDIVFKNKITKLMGFQLYIKGYSVKDDGSISSFMTKRRYKQERFIRMYTALSGF